MEIPLGVHIAVLIVILLFIIGVFIILLKLIKKWQIAYPEHTIIIKKNLKLIISLIIIIAIWSTKLLIDRPLNEKGSKLQRAEGKKCRKDYPDVPSLQYVLCDDILMNRFINIGLSSEPSVTWC
jgi:hypothetical protein